MNVRVFQQEESLQEQYEQRKRRKTNLRKTLTIRLLHRGTALCMRFVSALEKGKELSKKCILSHTFSINAKAAAGLLLSLHRTGAVRLFGDGDEH
jgi:hypothetical protein